jgi:hypothetical protein
MSYELAKQLKEAEFPSPLTRGRPEVYVPTLSELSEACLTDGFFQLHWTLLGWTAFSKTIRAMEACSTPEEAVATLWLALHNSK